MFHQYIYHAFADDAFITFRYAQNWAAGYGPLFNVGEHVEGYSNFLWLIILAAAAKLARLGIPQTTQVLGMTAGLATIVVTYQLGFEVSGTHRSTGLASAFLVAASGTFAAYAASGLETPLFALLTMGLSLAAIRGYWPVAGLLAGLVTLTRLDGGIFVIPVLVFAFLRAPSSRAGLRQAAQAGVVSLCLAVPWTVWRMQYYGHLTPTAIQAKSGMNLAYHLRLGINYVNSLGRTNITLLLVLLAAVLAAPNFGRPKNIRLSQMSPLALVAVCVAVCTLFVVLVGGNWMPNWRFLAPIVPLDAVSP